MSFAEDNLKLFSISSKVIDKAPIGKAASIVNILLFKERREHAVKPTLRLQTGRTRADSPLESSGLGNGDIDSTEGFESAESIITDGYNDTVDKEEFRA